MKSEYRFLCEGTGILTGVFYYDIENLYINWRINLLSSTVKEVPIWEKSNLTVEEAAAYTGIGINKIREMSNGDNCPFVLWVGNKRLIKRRKFDEYVEKQFSI